MTMTRRNFLETSLSGMALFMAQNESRADQWNANQGIKVVGVDGAALTPEYLQDYLDAGATVWQLSDNTVDFDIFDQIDCFVKTNSSKVTLARSYSDIVAAKRAGKVALVVGCQDMWPLEWQWESAKGPGPNDWTATNPKTDLSKLYDRGLRMGNLAYQLSNSFGGGLLDPTTPLSVAGKYMVDQMQEMGILVDCSHSSEQTTLDIIKRAKRPVVFSHSNVLALNDNIRNISDRQIEGAAKTGGLIGVNAVNAYLQWTVKDAPHAEDSRFFPPLASMCQYVDVMDHIRDLVGVDHIALGTDWTVGNPPDNSGTHFKNPPSFVLPPTMLYYSKYLEYVQNFDQVKDLPNLIPELKRHDYSSADIAKILGGNWMRVFSQAWD